MLDIRTRLGDEAGAAAILNNMGVIRYQAGNYEGALEDYLRSLEVRRARGNHRGAALVLNNMGRLYKDWGQIEEAEASFQEGLILARQADDASALGYSLNNLGELHESQGALEEARDFYRRSLEIYQGADLTDGVALNLVSLGHLSAVAGDPAGALEPLREARALAREAGNQEREARALAYLGLAERDAVGVGQALRSLSQALEIARAIGHRQITQEVLLALADTHADAGSYRTALEYHRAHTALRDSLFDERSGRRIAAMEARFEAEARARENAELRQAQLDRDVVIARQQVRALVGGTLLILVGILAFTLYRANQAKVVANQALAAKNEELSLALTRVQMLSGLIPICANCKKVRDDQGYWEQVETYISRHSEALFSHGICPDCSVALYPEVDQDEDDDTPAKPWEGQPAP